MVIKFQLQPSVGRLSSWVNSLHLLSTTKTRQKLTSFCEVWKLSQSYASVFQFLSRWKKFSTMGLSCDARWWVVVAMPSEHLQDERESSCLTLLLLFMACCVAGCLGKHFCLFIYSAQGNRWKFLNLQCCNMFTAKFTGVGWRRISSSCISNGIANSDINQTGTLMNQKLCFVLINRFHLIRT